MQTAQPTRTHVPAQREARPPRSDKEFGAGTPSGPALRLPRGGQLSGEAFALRARILRAVLVVHLAVVVVAGLFSTHLTPVGLAAWLAGAVALGLVGQAAQERVVRASATCLALLVCAAALVDASGGSTTTHFDFFVVLAFCAIYQEWVPYLLSIVFVAAHHLLLGTMCTKMVFGEPQLAGSPVVWALVHAAFVLAGCVAGVIGWALNEATQAESEEARGRAERLAQEQEEQRHAAELLERSRTEEARRDAETARHRAEDLRRRADGLAGSATRTRAKSDELTAAAVELASSVASVAASTSEATQVGRAAMSDAERLRDEFGQLTKASERIRDVVRAVAGIAGQTQMLALNAQIEAGRAGSAGAGFGVVAEEVKQLAEETRRATEEIDQSVRVLLATGDAAGSSLGAIEEVLEQIVSLQNTIAGAAEQQRGTSSAITASVTDVAQAVRGVSEAVDEMSRSAQAS